MELGGVDVDLGSVEMHFRLQYMIIKRPIACPEVTSTNSAGQVSHASLVAV